MRSAFVTVPIETASMWIVQDSGGYVENDLYTFHSHHHKPHSRVDFFLISDTVGLR